METVIREVVNCVNRGDISKEDGDQIVYAVVQVWLLNTVQSKVMVAWSKVMAAWR